MRSSSPARSRTYPEEAWVEAERAKHRDRHPHLDDRLEPQPSDAMTGLRDTRSDAAPRASGSTMTRTHRRDSTNPAG
jgi:hypothetical protein